MRRIFNLVLNFLALAMAGNMQAQSGSALPKPSLAAVKISGGILTGSAGINQSMMYRMALGGYIPREKIEKTDQHLGNASRAGFEAFYTLNLIFDSTGRYGLVTKRPLLYGISLEQQGMAGATFSQGAFRTTFLGNSAFAGEKLNLKAGFTQISTRILYVDWKWRRKQGGLTFGAGAGQLLSYRKLQVDDGYVYTHPDVAWVDVMLNGNFTNTGSNLLAGKGSAFATRLFWDFRKTEKKFRMKQVGFENLGMVFSPNADYYSRHMDSAARLSQTSISYKSLNTSNWITEQSDSLSRALEPDSTRKKIQRLTPFTISASAMLGTFTLALRYTYIQGYFPCLTLGAPTMHTKGLEWAPALQLGGWDTWNLNLSLGSHFRKTAEKGLDWNLKLYGLEAMVLPGLTHGAGLLASVKAHW